MTASELKEAWASYKKAQVLSTLSGGVWVHLPLIGSSPAERNPIAGTRCRIQPLRDVMEFPDFMEKHWGKKNKEDGDGTAAAAAPAHN